MCTVTIRLNPASAYLEAEITEAVRSVLGEQDTDWGVIVLSDPDSDNWNIGAQPGDGQPFEGVLDGSQHSPAAVRHMIFGFLQQYQDWISDHEE